MVRLAVSEDVLRQLLENGYLRAIHFRTLDADSHRWVHATLMQTIGGRCDNKIDAQKRKRQ